MTNTDFVARVQEIAARNPTYRTGGDGSDGTCDCIGLVMGALGREYPMHSSNYFARFEMAELRPLRDGDDLSPGELVYKTRSENNPRYDLHERYKKGGRYFASTLLDYYHVGVVTRVYPMEITHCTSTGSINGIARDTTLDGWTYAGEVDGLDYDEETEGEASMSTVMQVYAENGKPVNLRQRPDVNSPKVGEVSVGTEIEVVEQAAGWATIWLDGARYYMMDKFLVPVSDEPDDAQSADGQTVAVTLLLSAAQALYEALKGVM